MGSLSAFELPTQAGNEKGAARGPPLSIFAKAKTLT